MELIIANKYITIAKIISENYSFLRINIGESTVSARQIISNPVVIHSL